MITSLGFQHNSAKINFYGFKSLFFIQHTDEVIHKNLRAGTLNLPVFAPVAFHELKFSAGERGVNI